jgi:hypothetical protein
MYGVLSIELYARSVWVDVATVVRDAAAKCCGFRVVHYTDALSQPHGMQPWVAKYLIGVKQNNSIKTNS